MTSELRSGGRGGGAGSNGLWFGLLIVLVCGWAVALLFVTIGGWPDVRGLIVADAQTVKRDRVGQSGADDADAGEALAVQLSNSVAQQADAWEMRACLPQIARISDFLTAGQTYTALSQRIRKDAGEGSFSATIAARDQAGLDTISTLVSVPAGDQTCPSSYQTVAAFDERCDGVQVTHFSTFTEELAFGDRIQARHNGQGSYAYFLPFGRSGCVIVKTQMLD